MQASKRNTNFTWQHQIVASSCKQSSKNACKRRYRLNLNVVGSHKKVIHDKAIWVVFHDLPQMCCDGCGLWWDIVQGDIAVGYLVQGNIVEGCNIQELCRWQ